MIKSIKIKNFKACKNIELNYLGEVNYIVGKNRSGKSSLIQAIYNNLSINGIKKRYEDLLLKQEDDTWIDHIKCERQGYIDSIKFKEFIKDDTDINIEFYSHSYENHLAIFISQESEILKDLYFISSRKEDIDDRIEDLVWKSLTHSFYLEWSSLQNLQTSSYEDGGYGLHQKYDGFFGEIIDDYRDENNNIIPERAFIDNIKDHKLYSPENISSGEKTLYSLIRVLNSLDKNHPLYHKSRQGYSSDMLDNMNLVICIEEPESGLHIEWQKRIPKVINRILILLKEKNEEQESNIDIQFFITTHSPFFIRNALSYYNHKIFHIEDGVCKSFINKESIDNGGVIDLENILNSVGFEMKDIYYSNCLIYVEGASDLLYIEYWLNLYQQSLTPKFDRGLDYDFIEYGGTLASHLIMQSKNRYEKNYKYINILYRNRNIFFISDNDSIVSGGKGSTFENTKDRIQKEIEQLQEEGYRAKFFKFHNKDKISTIESLIWHNELAPKNTSGSKVEKAYKNILFWERTDKSLDDFEHNESIIKMIEEIYNFIKECNK